MTKVLLVEDDNNLREIYEARLQAEGYTIVSAHDGEEALVVAKAEKPDLIISDVMMPKISGFEMLDILRNTDSLKNVKVMMLTALGQSDDQQRADKLGADRYLVKSQVTLEDIVNVANELIKPTAGSPSAPDSTPTTTPPAADPSATTIASATTPPVASTTDSASSTDTPVTPTPTAAPPTIPSADPPVSDAPNPEPATLITSEPNGETTQIKVSEPKAELKEDEEKDKNLAESESEEKTEIKSQIQGFINDDSSSSQIDEDVPSSEPSKERTSPQEIIKPTEPIEPDNGGAIISTPENYSPQPTGKKVIAPLPGSESEKPDIKTLLERETAQEIIDNAGSTEANVTVMPTIPPPQPTPVVTPPDRVPVVTPPAVINPETVDPNSIAL
jgi:CheY-like chemotaxis protein